MGRFETGMLAQEENLKALTELSGRWIDRANGRTEQKKVILDLDSSESPVYGEQEGSAYNGYFGCDCYHPLFCFNQFGDLERALLRNGNVHSAEDWRSVLEPVVARYRGRPLERFFRADAAFASPDVYAFLEEERFGYAIRIPANEVLEREIADLLVRPVGRPSAKPKVLYADCTYRAESWDRFRRVVAKSGMACRRTLPSRELHRDEPDVVSGRACGEILQSTRHSRAMDQGGEARCEVDAALLP